MAGFAKAGIAKVALMPAALLALGISSAMAQAPVRIIIAPDAAAAAAGRSGAGNDVHVYRGVARDGAARTTYRVSTTIDYGSLAGILHLPGFDGGAATDGTEGCNRRCEPASRPASVMDDPTLRPGDMVVTDEGVKVYRGAKGTKRRPSDFQRAAATRLSASERRTVEAIDRMSGYGKAQQAQQQAQLDAPRAPALPARLAVATAMVQGR